MLCLRNKRLCKHPFGNTVNIRLAIDLDSIGSTIKSEATGSKKPVLLMSKISEEGTSAAQAKVVIDNFSLFCIVENLIFDLEALSSRSSYPAGTIASQDIFSSGIINSGTDFKVYKEIGGASGLDFAFGDHTAVYHTKIVKYI
ncbi:Endoplasmic reticulum metallopeptidase 1, partial [Mucuna pruriens]